MTRQQQTAAVVRRFWQEHGRAPRVRDVATLLGCSGQTAHKRIREAIDARLLIVDDRDGDGLHLNPRPVGACALCGHVKEDLAL